MARKKLKPVSIWGIEFDALIDETKNLSATIPTYPVEKGFPVSDTIILEPISVQMTLYISNTPVTWLYRHGSSTDRVNKICDLLEQKWLKKQLAKITELGFGSLPVCMAKNQYSLSDDAGKLGRPKNFDIHIREVYVSAGAGFVVALTGAIMTMPGLPKVPAANGIDVSEEGAITGLF